VTIALCLLPCVAAWGTTVVPMSIERLTGAAERVLEARATETWAQWNSDHTLIHTYTRFSVSRVLKGADGALVVKQLGGTAGGYKQVVAGVRHFRPGDQAVLFLRPSDAGDGTFVIVGLMQGQFRIQQSASGEAVVTNGVPEVSTYDAATRTGGIYRGSHMTLRELESRVTRALQQ
jgi:hypothetical protein